MERVFYTCFREERDDPELGQYATYGIAAFRDGQEEPVKTLRDVSLDRKKVARMVRAMNITQLPTDYLKSTVEGLLNQ